MMTEKECIEQKFTKIDYEWIVDQMYSDENQFEGINFSSSREVLFNIEHKIYVLIEDYMRACETIK